MAQEQTKILMHCFKRYSPESHLKPLDVILGLSVEAIVFFLPLAVMPVATKNESLAVILHLNLI